MVMREKKPGLLAFRVILANRSPLTFREIGTPSLPILLPIPICSKSRMLSGAFGIRSPGGWNPRIFELIDFDWRAA